MSLEKVYGLAFECHRGLNIYAKVLRDKIDTEPVDDLMNCWEELQEVKKYIERLSMELTDTVEKSE